MEYKWYPTGSTRSYSIYGIKNKAFYSLQGAGLYRQCVAPDTALHIYTTAVRSALTYGCASVHLSNKDLALLNCTQAKHIKSILGLNYNVHSNPLLQAIGIKSIADHMVLQSLEQLKANILSTSARAFYLNLLKCGIKRYQKLL